VQLSSHSGAVGEAAAEKADATLSASRRKARKVNRGHLPSHLPREEIVIEPPSKMCPCCGNDLHVIGEDRSERLDRLPARLRVIVTRRPKYACRTCERTGADETASVIQAPAPERLFEGGLPSSRRAVSMRRRRRGSSKVVCRPRRSSPTSLSANTRGTCRCTASRR
jgi:transposase